MNFESDKDDIYWFKSDIDLSPLYDDNIVDCDHDLLRRYLYNNNFEEAKDYLVEKLNEYIDKTYTCPTYAEFQSELGLLITDYTKADVGFTELKKESKWSAYYDRKPTNKSVEDLDGYDKDADAHLYILDAVRNYDDKLHYYVGSVIKDSLHNRINTHEEEDGHFAAPKIEDGVEYMARAKNVNYNIDIIWCEHIYNTYASDIEFKRVVLNKEDKLRDDISKGNRDIAELEDGIRVLGGK